MQDRQRDESGIGHRGRHANHRAAAEITSPSGANRQKDQREAEQGAAAERQQKTPLQEIACLLLSDGNNQQRRHRDIVGEMHEGVGQRPRDVAEPPGEPAGDDDRKHGKDQAGDLHLAALVR